MSLRSRASAALPALALLAGLTGALPAPVAAATTITVNTLADTHSATDGKCSLREAMTAVTTHAPSGNVTGECPAGSGVDLITFRVGGTIHLTDSLNAMLASTSATIDGGNVITIDGGDQYITMATSGTVALRHLVIQNGTSATGGGVISLEGALTLTDVVVSSSFSSGGGAGIYAQQTNLTLDHVQVSGNVAQGFGGGIYVSGGSLDMKDSRIFNNTVVSNGTGAGGGGIALRAAQAAITTSRIDHNDADKGGGLYVEGSSGLTLTRSTIDGNIGENDAGGLFSSDAGVGLPHYTIRTTTFNGNSTPGSGGAIFGWWDWMDVRTSTFSGNSSGTGGGAVQQQEGNDTSFVNATFAGNSSSGQGGAVTLAAGSLVLLNVTVTGNTSPSGGAAIDASTEFTSITLRNSIVVGNPGGQIKGNVAAAQDDTINASAVGILDPAGLKDNGGPTKTVVPLRTAIDVIGAGSSGDGCGNANLDGTDQRGVTRPTTACDIGAVQLESGKPTASAPKAVPAVGSAISSTVPVRITAGWSDPGGSGVKRFVLQKSVNGGSWSTVTSTMPAAGITLKLSTGSSYKFRVKPVDYDGNVGAYTSAGTAGTPVIRQQTYASFSGSWSSTSSTSFSGGSAKKSSSAGASASYSFTGRGIGFVTTTGPTRGKVKVYLDGSLKATVDLYASSTKYKVIAWSTRFSSSSSHTIKVVVVGSPSRPRVDVDAFTVLK